MSEAQLDTIISELQTLTKLLAINVLKDKSQTERISLLDEFGFENKAIANLLGTKYNIVTATKSNIVKSTKKPKKQQKNERIKETRSGEES